jgi:hypothetical protein
MRCTDDENVLRIRFIIVRERYHLLPTLKGPAPGGMIVLKQAENKKIASGLSEKVQRQKHLWSFHDIEQIESSHGANKQITSIFKTLLFYWNKQHITETSSSSS